mmetsp:Transcript_66343/g.117527  ORF Transcript_66343/g.117527 Transcript_66343/m.117527 type:complete len:206 (+) Transcript_66343:127-744(+)
MNSECLGIFSSQLKTSVIPRDGRRSSSRSSNSQTWRVGYQTSMDQLWARLYPRFVALHRKTKGRCCGKSSQISSWEALQPTRRERPQSALREARGSFSGKSPQTRSWVLTRARRPKHLLSQASLPEKVLHSFAKTASTMVRTSNPRKQQYRLWVLSIWMSSSTTGKNSRPIDCEGTSYDAEVPRRRYWYTAKAERGWTVVILFSL